MELKEASAKYLVPKGSSCLLGYKQTEVGVIPEDWETNNISDLTSVLGDGIHSTPLYSTNGDYFFINGNNLSDGSVVITEATKRVDHEEYLKHKNNLNDRTIFISINGTIGNLAYYNNEPVILGKSAAYLNVKNNFSKEYLYYAMQAKTVLQFFEDGLTGTTIKNLGLGTIRNTPIPAPPTKTEQTAIANALSDADAWIQSLTRLIAKKRQIKQGTMQTLLNPYENGHLKAGWVENLLGEVSYMKGRIGWQGLNQTEFTMNEDEPFLITGMNFKDGEIRWDEVYHISLERYEIAKEIQLKKDDVLMTKDGTIGKLLYINEIPSPSKASLNSHLLVFRPIRNSYNPKFLYYQLLSKLFKDHIEISKSGSTFFGLSQEAVGK